MHSEASCTGVISSLNQAPRFATPHSSPFQSQRDIQRSPPFSPRGISPRALHIHGVSLEEIERSPSGQPPATHSSCQSNVAESQSMPNQKQKISFEHNIRPLLPKTSNSEGLNSLCSSYSTVSGFVDTSQSRTSANAQHQQAAPTLEHRNQPYDTREFPNPGVSWLSPEQATSHNLCLTPPPSPNRWIQAREYRRRVHEPPYHSPGSDPTIAEVELDAEFWVRQLVLAITNVRDIKDTPSSHAARLFQPGTYDLLLIECTSRQIFASLLDRCLNGFRGPSQFNKALKTGKECEADRTATCEERMQNVIQALTWNKRVCKDVLYEDWKGMLLVNHPLGYDREKDSQKGSNDQRRLRQVNERETLKKTEEELLRFKQGMQRPVVQTGEVYNTAANAYPSQSMGLWRGDHNVQQEGIGTKRTHEEEMAGSSMSNAKHQRFG